MFKRFLAAGLTLALCLSFTACGANDTSAKDKVNDLVEIKEQPDFDEQKPEKIYPEERLQNDKVVSNSNIDKFVADYNAKAGENSKLSYDAIRYDDFNKCYYIFDKDKNSGIRFRLGDFGQIMSASVYTGNLKNCGSNLVDMATACMNTFGYMGMSDDDKDTMKAIEREFNEKNNNIKSNASLFGGSVSLGTSQDGNLSQIEIPSQPAAKDVASADKQNQAKSNMEQELSKAKKAAEPSSNL